MTFITIHVGFMNKTYHNKEDLDVLDENPGS
jgi:hypothetical protein